MDKEQLLEQVKAMAAEHSVSREELITSYNDGAGNESFSGWKKHLSVAKILYYIGGAIVIMGIIVLIEQNWEVLNTFTRIIVTLGVGIAMYVAGTLLYQQKEKFIGVANAFHLIAAPVILSGIFVTLHEFEVDIDTYGMQSFIFGMMLFAYIISYVTFKKNVFLVFTIILGTFFFFNFTDFLTGPGLMFDEFKFFMYRVLAISLMYLLLGYSFADSKPRALTGALYGFGSFGFLGSALALGGWSPDQNIFWELIFPGLAFGMLFLSIHVKSKVFLVFGAFYLMAYIIKITSEYFADSLGWPFALVLIGFFLIGVGYLTLYLNHKYLSRLRP